MRPRLHQVGDRPAIPRTFDATRESRARMREALGSEPFDAAKFGRAVQDWRQTSDAAQQAVHAMLLEAALKMSAKGRAALVPGRARD